MTKAVICPRCGARVDSRGLQAHVGSKPCRVEETHRYMARRGYVRTHHNSRLLRACGVRLEYDLIGYCKIGRRRVLAYGHWAPKWAVAIAGLKLPLEHRKRLLMESAALRCPTPEAEALLAWDILEGS